MLSDAEFRVRLRGMLDRSGQSMRGLSSAMGRDPGYVAALLDPDRPSRARPTPSDLVAASDATGIPLVEWLRELWNVDPARVAREIREMGVGSSRDERLDGLSIADLQLVLALVASLRARDH